jgi:hypothetical protein
MKICYRCRRGYRAGRMFCPHDGTFLFHAQITAFWTSSIASVRLLLGTDRMELSFSPLRRASSGEEGLPSWGLNEQAVAI